jgi:hypothetical protein
LLSGSKIDNKPKGGRSGSIFPRFPPSFCTL